MALKTTNAGSLVSGAIGTPQTIRIRLLIATFIKGYGDMQIGDECDVSITDAQYLTGYKYAEIV